VHSYTDCFGYVPVRDTVDFEAGTFEPLPQFDEVCETVAQWVHPDGHVYLPAEHTRTQKPHWKRSRKVPQSERPARQQRLPATHSVIVAEEYDDEQAARYGAVGFLVHLFGLLYGFQCQFHDWWINGRFSLKGRIDHGKPRPKAAGEIVSRALEIWRSFPQRQRLVAINALYLHSRSEAYQVEWERFQAEYQVFDAVFALAKGVGHFRGTGRIPHARRIRAICDRFGIRCDDDKMHDIVRLRNDLLHEALWDRRMPGEARSDTSFRASYWLHSLARRALFATLGLDGEYIRSAWWGMGSHVFDLHAP